MSFNRENVTWKTANGTWRKGFYTVIETGDPFDEDHDPEWDVDYDFDSFEWVGPECATEQQADETWNGPNPGCGWVIDDPKEAKDLDHMARRFLDPEFARKDDLARARKRFATIHSQIAEKLDLTSLKEGTRVDYMYGEGNGSGIGGYDRLIQEGDWLVRENKDTYTPSKVYNTKTGKLYRRGEVGIVRLSIRAPRCRW